MLSGSLSTSASGGLLCFLLPCEEIPVASSGICLPAVKEDLFKDSTAPVFMFEAQPKTGATV